MSEQSTGETLENTVDTTVTISRLVSSSPKHLWKFLVTREGAEALLGSGGELGDKGDSWHSADGTYGVIRSYHPLEQVRFSWHAAEDAPKTIVDVHLRPEGADETTIEVVHSGIPRYFDVAAISRRWEAALDALVTAAAAEMVAAG
ncbi:MAG TPA: SRPBCC domain-containing protein [Propionicimonas sp.]|jgi:uncharacterized protein YndB with AHSA1/START domain|nr:SRPBCC domain-containing protein [Propionicimonas sp.]